MLVMAAASTSAAPIPFARMESNAEAFGYLPKRLEVRDCGLFGRPRPHDPLLAIGLDGLNPIGVAEWDNPLWGATPTDGQAREGSGGARLALLFLYASLRAW